MLAFWLVGFLMFPGVGGHGWVLLSTPFHGVALHYSMLGHWAANWRCFGGLQVKLEASQEDITGYKASKGGKEKVHGVSITCLILDYIQRGLLIKFAPAL